LHAALSASLKSEFGHLDIWVQRWGFETAPSLSVLQLYLKLPSF
jgi:hypothetical protein